MNADGIAGRVAVCSWSLQAESPEELVSRLSATGIRRVQLALDPIREGKPGWSGTEKLLQAAGIDVVSGMFGCVGEDYSSLDSIRVTGGIAPDTTWQENYRNIEATAALAKRFGLKLVTFHAGFVPHDDADPNFKKMVERLRAAADVFAREQLVLGLETGQETAPALIHLLKAIDRSNVRVNFDPANMILYDKGNPIEALRLLLPWICQVHIKDAIRTKTTGTWGEEVAAGTGEVDWRAFFTTLEEAGYTGNLVIEREAGNQRAADIRTARETVEKLCKS